MAFEDAHHVKIDGKGYILDDESYAWQAQKPFNPRFATGDPGLGDLSFWQFLSQEDFSGGQGQKDFTTVNKYLKSIGWDFSNGRPRLAYNVETLTPTASPPSISSDTVLEHLVQVLQCNGAIYLIYPSGADFTVTTIQAEDVANNKPAIYHVSGRHGIIMLRDSNMDTLQGHALAVCASASVRFFDSANAELATYVSTKIAQHQVIVQVGTNKFLAFGSAAVNNGIPRMALVTLTTGSWSASAETRLIMDGSIGALQGNFLNSYAKDADSTIYLAFGEVHTNILNESFRILRIVSADQTLTQPQVSQVDYLKDFLPRAIFDVNGTVFMAGAFQEDEGTFERGIIKFPNTEIWRSKKLNTNRARKPRHTQLALHQSLNSALLLMENDYESGYKPILKLHSDGSLREVAAFPTDFDADVPGPHAIFYTSGRYWWVDANDQLVRRTTQQRGIAALDKSFTTSRFGANTVLIEKSLFKLRLEISKVLPLDGGKLKISVNDVYLGSMSGTDKVRKEFLAISEISGPWFQVTITGQGLLGWDGTVERVMLQFIPVNLKKLAWSFLIRADESQRLLSGQGENRNADEIEQDLKKAWKSNVPVDFLDRDGREYKVIVSDVKGRVPLIGDNKFRRESKIAIELLEV